MRSRPWQSIVHLVKMCGNRLVAAALAALLGLAAILASCSDIAAPAKSGEVEHRHQAPHGGTLIELGEEFAHLERAPRR
jgi:hypothetical protein